jgi:hypothetical protein
VDIDECAAGTDTCSATAKCVNKPGTYACVGDDPLLCLDGASDYGRALPMTSAVATLTSATVELWFKSNAASGEQVFYLFHPADLNAARTVTSSIVDASAQGFSSLSGRILTVTVDARDNGGNLNARGFDLDATLAGFDETAWHHYAFVFNGVTQRAFVDGVELTVTQQRDGAQNTSFQNAFGSSFVASGGTVTMDVGWFPRLAIRYLNGYLEDLRVSSTARYAGAFAPTYPLDADGATVAAYRIDEGTGTTSADYGTGGYTITWTGATWGSCAPSYAVDFDGVNDGLSSSVALGRGLSSTVTIEYWIRPDAIGPWMKILNIHNADNRDVDMEIRPDGKVYCTLFDQTGGNHGSTSTSVLSSGTWYHVACSYDGSTQRMFINGTLQASTAWTGQVQLNDTVTISGFESRYVNGTLDEFRLSSTARYTVSFTPPSHFTADGATILLWLFNEGSGTTSTDGTGSGFHAVLGTGPGVGGPPMWVMSDR